MSVKQLGRRLLQIVIVLIGISFFTFILTYLAPGDPVRTRYAASGMVPTEKELQEERERLGLNDPVLVQYGRGLVKFFMEILEPPIQMGSRLQNFYPYVCYQH